MLTCFKGYFTQALKEPGDYSCPQKSAPDQLPELSCPPISRFLPFPDSSFLTLIWVAPAGSAWLPVCSPYARVSQIPKLFFSVLPSGTWPHVCPVLCWISPAALNPAVLPTLSFPTWTLLLFQEYFGLDFRQIPSFLVLTWDNSFALLYKNTRSKCNSL